MIPTPPPPQKHTRGPLWQEAGWGFALGVLIAVGLMQLIHGVFAFVETDPLIPLIGLAGALVAPTRARPALGVAAVVVALTLMVVGYSPLVGALMPGLIRRDPPRPAPAVVVLSSMLQRDGTLSSSSQERLVHGYELLGEGHARRLVVTRLAWRPYSYVPAVSAQMRRLHLDCPIDEVGPVRNTHDEAVAVTRLARERGWDRVLLVTHPWHMRRAAALFEKAGLAVICSPCAEGRYELQRLDSFPGRLAAFRDWAHEAVGLWIYRRRGWI
jgi:uncharacterized SAM-binding protein YcdF (DUF218 family)